jgi:prepilin-type N-terminal cleavage/methylation domain-containing protein
VIDLTGCHDGSHKQAARRPRSGIRIGRGFTLIELLVVISIITILISILMPSLKAVREQAKRVVCQSNLKNIDTSLLTYIAEYDSYPVLFQTRPDNCNYVSWATWSFGGWTGKDYETFCNRDLKGTFCFETYERPLSVYMMEPHRIPPDDPGLDGDYGTHDDLVTEMPVFRCPADKTSSQWQWRPYYTPSADVADMSAYEQIGSSYQMNFYWFYQARERARQEIEPGPCYGGRLWSKAFEIGMQLWRRSEEYGGASRFVTVVEDPIDWGIAQGLSRSADADAGPDYVHESCGEQTMGFHGQWSRHMAAFLDGHVDYVLADTRFQRESDWTTTNDEWFDTRCEWNCPE